MTRLTLSLPALLLLTACAAVGPDPAARPDVALPAGYVEGDAQPLGEVGQHAFWAEYNDSTLTAMIERGLSQNLSVLAADERIRAAQAGQRGAGAAASQISGDASLSAVRQGVEGMADSDLATTSLSAGFVFDLFGGAQRAREAANANLLSAAAGAQTARLAWVAEVISAYADARYYQESMALTRNTVTTRERTVEVTRNKVDAGTATQIDMAQAQAQLALARADLPTMEASFNANVFRLAVLLNEDAGGLMRQMQRGSAMLRTPAMPRSGVPADLLRNRPDVRAAEHQLTAALAQAGVAEANLYPQLRLTGAVTDLSTGADRWSFGPQISLPLFNQEALRASQQARASEAAQAEIAWRAAITSAVGDVQTAQSNLRRGQQRVGLLRNASNALDEAYGLARQNFEEGSMPLLDLLQVDRSRFDGRLAIAAAQNANAKAWAQLQIATGSGAALR